MDLTSWIHLGITWINHGDTWIQDGLEISGTICFRLEVADYSAPVSYFMSGFIVKAPNAVNIMEVPAKFLFSPFQLSQWLLLLGSMILVSIILVIFTRLIRGSASMGTFGDAIFDVARSVVLQTRFQGKHLAPRILFVGFEISMFFVVRFYTSYLTSSLLVSLKPKDPFTGFHQFAQLVYDRKYTLITDDIPGKHVPITDKLDSADPKVKMKIAYQWNPPVFVDKNDFETIVQMIIANDSLVYYGSYYHLLHGTSKSCDVKVIVDTYTHPTWLAFAFTKGKTFCKAHLEYDPQWM